jgi:hypothetical protein
MDVIHDLSSTGKLEKAAELPIHHHKFRMYKVLIKTECAQHSKIELGMTPTPILDRIMLLKSIEY